MRRLPSFSVLTLSLLVVVPVHAQDRYLDPPPAIARILDQPLTPAASLSPDGQWLLLMDRPSLPPIAEVAAPDLRLAGVRLDPVTNGPSRSFSFTGFSLRQVNGTLERPVQKPSAGRPGGPRWSPDGTRFAYTVTMESGIALWVSEVSTGESRRLVGPVLNAVFGSPCDWVGSDQLVCRVVPEGRGPAPRRALIPRGPISQESQGRAAPNRTYQDLLESPEDEALFEYYFTNQVVLVGLDGSVRKVGAPGIHGVDPSPDGRYLAVTSIHRPFSYQVPLFRFPQTLAVWDLAGNLVRHLADIPLREEVPPSFDAVPEGPRGLSWRADVPATLVWVEARDGGDPRRQASVRDEVLTLAAPFQGTPATLQGLAWRSGGIDWLADGSAVVNERWSRTRSTRSWLVSPGQAPRVLFPERSADDRYGDPGRFLTTTTASGTSVIQTTRDGRNAFLMGSGSSPEGDRPFLRRIELATGKVTELWRSEAPYYESPVALVDAQRQLLVTERESADEPPNYFLRDLGRRRLTQLTTMTDPAPEFKGISKELVTYTRADGVQLSATLYLPPGYRKEQGPIPFMLWAYPREFRDADAASQITGSPYRFTRPGGSSHLFLLLAGYGILDDPKMPIIGEGDAEPNDRYVEQLVASAQAAVDKIVTMGVADRSRIGVGGHSYGAFMTANLLAHSDIFRAGIARSGAYNRTLTPFGFQAEERTYWQAPEVYTTMSPFTYADRIKEPMLMIHGQDDDNSGTFPVQSERMYAAVTGNGGTARLVWLPGEAHGYRARESVGHTLYEMVAWMDRWVKGDGRAATP